MINTYLLDFTKVDNNSDYILGSNPTNITICGEQSVTITLPSNPMDGMTINISNLSGNNLLIKPTNNIMYNLLLAPNGKIEVVLQSKHMYIFIYTEDSNQLGNWYFRF